MVLRKIVIFVVLVFTLVVSAEILWAVPQNAQSDSTANSENARLIEPTSMTQLKDLKSLWEITRFGGFFRWFIIGIFVLGMITIVYKVTELLMDSHNSHQLEKLNLRRVTLVDVMRVIKTNKHSMLSQLFKYMMDLYQTRRSAEGFSNEIIDYVQIQQDRFQAFQAKMSFFSDTAGALGLLGTVWGMFMTFFGGDLEKHKILSGMGVALITTLMGLVVSIFLNLFATQTHSYFRRRIDKVADLGNQFRLRLHQLEQTLDNSLPDLGDVVDTNGSGKTESYEISKAVIDAVDRQLQRSDPIFDLVRDNETAKAPRNGSFKLVPISGDNQAVKVNNKLEKPFVVQISSQAGNGLSDQPILFEVVVGNGKLGNGRKQEEVLSDASGLAQTRLILGSLAGENKVKVKLKGSANSDFHFTAWGQPTEPDRLVYVSGNHQNARCGTELQEPFIVKVMDKYDNPISDWAVSFKVDKGKGFFPEKKSDVQTRTDQNGLAEVYFTLGKKPGFNAVKASVKGLKKSRLQFEALGQG